MSKYLRPLLFSLAVPLSACSIEMASDDDSPSNMCSASEECGSGASCITSAVGENVCVANNAQLGSVLLEVQLSGGTGASYLFPDALVFDGAIEGGLVQSLNLTLPPSVPFTGRVKAAASESCIAKDGAVPVDVTLHRKPPIGNFRYELNATSSFSEGSATADFSLSVPPGLYDVYLEPQLTSDTCALIPPPRLVSGVAIEGEAVDFEPEEEAFKLLNGTFTVAEGVSLEGWVVELVEPKYGHRISDRIVLGAPQNGVTVLDGGLRYYETPDQILVRLRDPEGDLEVHWELAPLDLDADGYVDIELGDLTATPMPIGATILDPDLNLVPGAKVRIQSVALTGTNNQNATYSVTTTSDADGAIHVSLVPGDYAVTIMPDVPGVAPLLAKWKIEADGGGSGLGFTLPKQPLVQGVALDPTGAPLASAPLLFSPAQPQDSSYAAIVRSKPDPSRPIFWPTRPQSGLTSDFGDFELPVDPGQMNVVVQMAPESGFPWAVIPNLLIDTADVTPVMDLGELSVRYPALAQGLISNDTGPVSYAVVRAWIQPKQGDSVGPLVQIGATSTDEAGVFVLPLPPSITLPAEDATPAEP